MSFSYVVTSDGFSMNLHYRRILKKKTEEEKENPFMPSNLKRLVESGEAAVWGVDPGVRSIDTVIDNINHDQQRIRSMSSKEYYQRIGQTAYKRFVKQHDESPQNANTLRIIHTLLSLKTSNMRDFLDAFNAHIASYPTSIKRHYAYLNDWSLELYRKKKRCFEEMVEQLFGDSKKYSPKSKSFQPKYKSNLHNKPNLKNLTPEDAHKQKVVVGFGGAVFRAGVGCRSGPLKSFFNTIYLHATHNPNAYLFKVNEYLTSQACNLCQTSSMENKKSATGTDIHAVLQCTQCHQIVKRNENAAANIRDILIYSCLHDSNRKTPFQIPENDQ